MPHSFTSNLWRNELSKLRQGFGARVGLEPRAVDGRHCSTHPFPPHTHGICTVHIAQYTMQHPTCCLVWKCMVRERFQKTKQELYKIHR